MNNSIDRQQANSHWHRRSRPFPVTVAAAAVSMCTVSLLGLGSANGASAKSASQTKGSSQPRGSSQSRGSSPQVEHLPTTSLQIPFALFKNPGTIVSFKYPHGWQPQKTEDKDTIIKLSGTTDGGLNGEISLGKFGDTSVKAETARHLVEDLIFAKLENFRKIQQKTIALGANRKLVGYLEDVSFTVGGMNASQRWVFFDSPLGAHYLTFTAPVAQFSALMPIYNEVLLSVSDGGSSTSAMAGATASDANGGIDSAGATWGQLSRYQSPTLPVTFSYPAGWQIEDEAAGDMAVKITGKNKEGQAAEITVYRGSSLPWTSTEQLADAIEKEFYQPQDSFRRVNRQTKDFGNMSKMSGVIQENSFKYKGQPVKQLVAIFEHDDRAYAMSFISPGWKESEMRQLFHRILATMSVKD